jgi:hypothetical protein
MNIFKKVTIVENKESFAEPMIFKPTPDTSSANLIKGNYHLFENFTNRKIKVGYNL